ncbi:hypothetical protein [Cecembia sp.]|uniref:hypothetical protein n=1 Tax=Cecembia sp. TaxID=1898110 RepID=UPI0025C4D122|nr:hypothetical protein [Cecembia sp.]
MKHPFYKLFILLSILTLSFACGEKSTDPEPQKTPEELAIEDLAGSGSEVWGIANGGSVQRDGRSETNIYQNFTITFSANNSSKTYQTSNGNSLFDASGNWNFASGSIERIILTGSSPASGQEITFTRSGNNLRLQFNIPIPEARVNAIAGSYVFNLTRQ